MKTSKLIVGLTAVALLFSMFTTSIFAADTPKAETGTETADITKTEQPKDTADIKDPPPPTAIPVIINYYNDSSIKENFLGTNDIDYDGKAGMNVVLGDSIRDKFLPEGYVFDKYENDTLKEAGTTVNVIYKKSEVKGERVLNVYAYYPLSDNITHTFINRENWDKHYPKGTSLTEENVANYYEAYKEYGEITHPYYKNYAIYGRVTPRSEPVQVKLVNGIYDVSDYAVVSVALTYGSYRHTINHHFNDTVVKGETVKGAAPTLTVSTDLGAEFASYAGYEFSSATINDKPAAALTNIALDVKKETFVDLYYTKEEVVIPPTPQEPYYPPYVEPTPQEPIVEETVIVEEIPLAKPAEIVEIVDADVPLGKLPQSGGLQALGFGAAGLSALLAGVLLTLKKKSK